MLLAIREMWDAMQNTPRDMLDESGLWPRDLIPKMAVAAIYTVGTCLMAHYAPFTLEAFITALLSCGLHVLGILIFMSVGAGVLAAIMCIREEIEARRNPSMTVQERREAARLCDAQSGGANAGTSLLCDSVDALGDVKGGRDVPGTTA